MWKYLGDGFAHYPGIPARDLTDAEGDALNACVAPGQVWLVGPDGADYPFNVVPVRWEKTTVDENGEPVVLRFDLSTLGLWEHVPDAKAGKKVADPAAVAAGVAGSGGAS